MLSTTAAGSVKSSDLLGSREIKHVVVLGANGAMGLGSGALFTTAVPRVTFLARTKEKADGGLAAAVKMVRSSTVANRVDTGSYEDDFDRVVGEADLIVDTHGAEVINPVWDLLDKAYEHFGVIPTLLERDFNFPPLSELLSEVDTIRDYQRKWDRNDEIRVAQS